MAKSRSGGDPQHPHTYANGHAAAASARYSSDDARPPGHFDLEGGRFALSPRMAWSLLGAAALIGAGVAATNLRIGGVETSIAEMREEISSDRANHQTRQQAYIDCLEHERANKGTVCPMGKAREPETIPVAAPPAKKPRRTATKPEQPSIFSWPFSLTSAQAKGGK
jgi:hypothetical protein